MKSWSFRYRDRTTSRLCRATIGQFPAIGLSAARSVADTMRSDVASGGNPAEQKKQDRAGGRSSATFGSLAERYLDEYSRRHKRSHAADDRNLRLHVLPRWKNRAYATIRRADVIELIEGLVSDGKQTLANRVQSLISSVFTFALDADLVESNPCYRLKKRGVESIGRRVLSDGELRLFWNAIVEPAAAKRTGLGLRLALLTGARVGEVAGLSRAELQHPTDSHRAAWIIPGARTKNGRDHLIPLSPLARRTVLDLLAMIEQSEKYLFPTRSQGRDGPMRSNTLTQAMDYFGKRLADGGEAVRTWEAEPPTPHDLRRTVETRLAELRFPKEIRDRVLNHVSAGVGDKHYNLHDYAAEKRGALNRWSAVVSAIVKGRGSKALQRSAEQRGARR
ncbi:MAG: site-specific integrase [Alphaproteobacteria bacterium]|nr:site-specific integrase [Alphaproteobacteria bacterium]